jgi:trigger factor
MAEKKIYDLDIRTTILKDEGLEFHAKVEIPINIINDKIQKELLNLSSKVKMDGFRAGKVPKNIVQKKYGASVRGDILQHEVSHAIDKIVKDNKLNIATDPKIEEFKAEDGKDVEFKLKFERLPKIEMPDFKKVSVEKPILKIDDKDVSEKLNKLAEFSKDFSKESKSKASKGDQVTIDAIGYVDGEAFEGGKLNSHKLVLGSKSFIDTFEDQLIGTKKGDEVTVKVKFPEKYHAENLAGKPSEFKVKVLTVHKPDETEINDEFAKKFKHESVDKLKEQISSNLKAEFADPINTIMKMSLFDQLEKVLDFEVPTSLVDREYEILKSQAQQLKESDDTLKGKSEEDLDKYYKKLSLRRVRIGLMLAEYVQLKKLTIEQNDIKDAVMAQARNFPGQEMEIIEYYQKNQSALEALKGPILEEKGVKYLFENEIKIKEKEYSRKELEKFLEKENNRDLI